MELSVLVPYSRAPTIWNGSVCSRPAGAPWRGDSRREKVRRIAAGAFRGRRAGRKGEEDCRRGGGVGPKSAVRWSPRPPKRHVTLNFWRPSGLRAFVGKPGCVWSEVGGAGGRPDGRRDSIEMGLLFRRLPMARACPFSSVFWHEFLSSFSFMRRQLRTLDATRFTIHDGKSVEGTRYFFTERRADVVRFLAHWNTFRGRL